MFSGLTSYGFEICSMCLSEIVIIVKSFCVNLQILICAFQTLARAPDESFYHFGDALAHLAADD